MKKLLILLSAIIGLSATATAVTASNPPQHIVLTPENTVVFRGEVSASSTMTAQLELVNLIRARKNAKSPIYLVFDSPGGSIAAGDAFISFVKTLPNVQTITLFAASMAAGIVESLPGRRLITDNGILMFHRARGQIEGQFEDGEMEAELALYKSIVRAMEQRNADRLGISLSDYKAKVKDEYWLFGPQATAQKAADEIVDVSCSNELIDSRIVMTQQIMIFTIKQEFSGCPLLRSPIPSNKPQEEE